MTFYKDSILFSNYVHFLIKDLPFVICDVGARNFLTEPWKTLHSSNKEIIKIIGFEPDKNECKNLKEKNPNNQYFDFALWNTNSVGNIHVAEETSTSSIYPPNFEILKQFEQKNWKPRITKSIEKIQMKKLDSIDIKDIDFIKIDTQGSEYEILEGATKCLKEDCFGITLETWTEEIHKGQKLCFDIMKFMHEQSFTFFDLEEGAHWKRKTAIPNLRGKSQITQVDLLYFKKIKNFFEEKPSFEKIVKAIAIADVWGFPDYSFELIEKYEKEFSNDKLRKLKSEIISRRKKRPFEDSFINKGFMKFKEKYFNVKSFPNIH